MRHPLFANLLVLFAAVASGALECDRIALSPMAKHGGDLYGRMCSVCHGAAGEGYKADQATALAHPDFLASATDDYLRSAITNGRSGTTMSAWATMRGGPLTSLDVDAIIAFMRAWQDRPRATLDEGPLKGDASRGSPVYAQECARCHGARGTGGPNVSIGNRDLLASATNGFLRSAIRGGRTGTAMPAFGQSLGDASIDDLVAVLRTFQSTAPALAAMPTHPPPIPLGPVPLNPNGPEPKGFRPQPATTPADGIEAELVRGARMAILDARAPSDYSNEHIAGAVSVPFYDPDPYMNDLPKDAWLVCYCACPHAESGQLAQKLMAKGFTKVTVLDEGLGVWKARKYPTHVGLEP